MHLNNLKTAWSQLKIMNSLQLAESNEILSIIEEPENLNNFKKQRIFIGLAIFLLITLFCQAG
jgi:hypothetical protein